MSPVSSSPLLSLLTPTLVASATSVPYLSPPTSSATTTSIPFLTSSSTMPILMTPHHKSLIKHTPHPGNTTVPHKPLSPLERVDLRVTTIAMLALSGYILFILLLAGLAKRRRAIRSCRGRRLSISRGLMDRIIVVQATNPEMEQRPLLG